MDDNKTISLDEYRKSKRNKRNKRDKRNKRSKRNKKCKEQKFKLFRKKIGEFLRENVVLIFMLILIYYVIVFC